MSPISSAACSSVSTRSTTTLPKQQPAPRRVTTTTTTTTTTTRVAVAKKKRSHLPPHHDDGNSSDDEHDDGDSAASSASSSPYRVLVRLNKNQNNVIGGGKPSVPLKRPPQPPSNSTATRTLASSVCRTLPNKKFRKLSLVDTPQTPGTLIKKSSQIIEPRSVEAAKTNNKLIKNVKVGFGVKTPAPKPRQQPAPVCAIEEDVTMACESSTTISQTNRIELVTPPPSAVVALHFDATTPEGRTPTTTTGTAVRTPSLLKAPVAVNPNRTQGSPRRFSPVAEPMLVDAHLQPAGNVFNSARLGKSAVAVGHSRRLFDHNGNAAGWSNMNKKLQFDEEDSDAERPVVESPSVPKVVVTFDKTPAPNKDEVDDEMWLLFEHPTSPTFPNAVGSSVQSFSGKTNLQPSSSVFKPISRLINEHYNSTPSHSSLHPASAVVTHQRTCCHNSICVEACTTTTTTTSRSPHSPFQLNAHLQANINPFTPTNSFQSATPPVSSIASNSAALIKFAAASAAGTLAVHATSAQRNGMSVKRVHEHDHPVNSSGADNEEDTTATSASPNTNQFNTSNNSLPKNKRLALRQCLVSRYHEEFHEVCKLGNGEFGDVFKCINRLDGCTYAIKRSKRRIAGSALEMSAWKEVCAHAVLVKHNHIVQYYSAWAEADRMLIQNEYCNGGSLAEFIESLRASNVESTAFASGNEAKSLMNEYDLKVLLLHIAKGLGYMHSLNLVHLDIKPGNIFICRTPRRHVTSVEAAVLNVDSSSSTSSLSNAGVVINEESGIESEDLDDDEDDEEEEARAEQLDAAEAKSESRSNSAPKSTNLIENAALKNLISNRSMFSEVITYKIGDLGHVTSTLDPHVEEGDCRYLPNEILQEQYDHLPKADVFALALTVFVSGSLEELPKNGDEWHWIRQGNLKPLNQCSERFNKLLVQMVSESPETRPSASTLMHHRCIVPDANKSKAQLRKELNHEKFKNEVLKQKVKKYEQQLIQQMDSPNASTLLDRKQAADLRTLNTGQNLRLSGKFTRSISSTLL